MKAVEYSLPPPNPLQPWVHVKYENDNGERITLREQLTCTRSAASRRHTNQDPTSSP